MNYGNIQSHIGQNISRIRELRGIKQNMLGESLNMSQQAVSLMEKKRTIDDKLLDRVAQALNMKPERIKSFDPNHLLDLFNDDRLATDITDPKTVPVQTKHTLNRLIDALEENKLLYQRLLEAERSDRALLEKIVNNVRLFEHELRSFPMERDRSNDMREYTPYLRLLPA